jgi:hypothetical protein
MINNNFHENLDAISLKKYIHENLDAINLEEFIFKLFILLLIYFLYSQ